MRFDLSETPGVFGLSQGKRESTAHSIVAFTVSSGHLRLSKLPSDFRRLRGLLAATRFNGRRFARNGRNAYLRRNTLSGLRFCLLSHYVMERRPRLHASPYGKGRCHEVTEGIRKSRNSVGRVETKAFFRINREPSRQLVVIGISFAQGSQGVVRLLRSPFRGDG